MEWSIHGLGVSASFGAAQWAGWTLLNSALYAGAVFAGAVISSAFITGYFSRKVVREMDEALDAMTAAA